jgi:cysteine desulfurase / selenocysteine lyase
MLNGNPKARFPLAQQVAYLDTAAEGLPPAGCEQALGAYLREKYRGTLGHEHLFEAQLETECLVARLLGTAAENVVLLANASEPLNLLANSIEWRPGDRVLVTDLEFPSNVLPWLRKKALGVELEVLPTEHGKVELEQFLSRITEKTRVVAVSLVSYKSGTRIPFLRELAEVTHRAGGILCVDATQALGRVPVSVEGVDFLVASGYKWLLGMHGLGVVYFAPDLREQLRPQTIGWYSVQDLFSPSRFERFIYNDSARSLQPGMPNFPAMYALKNGVEYLLSIGVERIDQELRPLVSELREGLRDLGTDLLTPCDSKYASGIVAFANPDPEAIGASLQRAGVVVWVGDGRVRASVHVYNDRTDVRRCLEALRTILPS